MNQEPVGRAGSASGRGETVRVWANDGLRTEQGHQDSFQVVGTALIGAFRDISVAAWRLARRRTFTAVRRYDVEQNLEQPLTVGSSEAHTSQRRSFRPFERHSALRRRFASAAHSVWTIRGRPRPSGWVNEAPQTRQRPPRVVGPYCVFFEAVISKHSCVGWFGSTTP